MTKQIQDVLIGSEMELIGKNIFYLDSQLTAVVCQISLEIRIDCLSKIVSWDAKVMHTCWWGKNHI